MPTNPVTHKEMQPLTSVFGGTKNTPRAVFDRSRTENAGTVVATRANDMAMACPRCDAAGTESRLFSRADAGYYCVTNGAHKWNDYAARHVDWKLLPAFLPRHNPLER